MLLLQNVVVMERSWEVLTAVSGRAIKVKINKHGDSLSVIHTDDFIKHLKHFIIANNLQSSSFCYFEFLFSFI